ncbi:MAG: hypothetical protein IPO04_17435 [Cytophagaceae bacterium]|nr:hypothetical protein [Cytophagaceae bacterium]
MNRFPFLIIDKCIPKHIQKQGLSELVVFVEEGFGFLAVQVGGIENGSYAFLLL